MTHLLHILQINEDSYKLADNVADILELVRNNIHLAMDKDGIAIKTVHLTDDERDELMITERDLEVLHRHLQKEQPEAVKSAVAKEYNSLRTSFLDLIELYLHREHNEPLDEANTDEIERWYDKKHLENEEG